MQQLSGRQIGEIIEALLDAFPARDELRHMVRIELDERLEAIADGTNQRVVIFNLVSWAESRGKIDTLLQGATRQNPGNPTLQKLMQSWRATLPPEDAKEAARPPAPPDDRPTVGNAPTDARGSQGAIFNASGPITQHYEGYSAEQVRELISQLKGVDQPKMWDGPASIDLFLSYSRKDLAAMRQVQEVLRAAGLSVWTDEGLKPGTPSWRAAIEEAVKQAAAMVVLLSPNAKASQWVDNEVGYAEALNKRIFPLLIAGDRLNAVPISLIRTQWVDGRENLRTAVEQALLPSLRHHLGLPEPVSESVLATPQPPIAFDWVTIPAGEFLMGSDKQKDQQAWDDETPQHTLYLPEYRISRTPVTVAQFAAFVAATGYKTWADERGAAYVYTGSGWEDVKGANWAHPRGPQSDVSKKQNHPVTVVAWRDAQAFCGWAGVRLPTEAEWEKAARGPSTGSGSGRIYPWGDAPPTDKLCNFDGNVNDTTPVGNYPAGASPYGCLDMAGNVWEWTGTRWRYGYPYDASDGREDLSGADSVWRVVRGGSWATDLRWVRCAARYGSGGLWNLRGFRVVSPGF